MATVGITILYGEDTKNLIQGFGICSGIGLKEDILKNPMDGLPKDIGIPKEFMNEPQDAS